MLLSIQSIEDKNEIDSRKSYSRIRTNVNIPWECQYIKYHVSSLNTKANILITTTEDKIVIEDDDKNYEAVFEDKYSLSEINMLTYLSELSILTVSIVI